MIVLSRLNSQVVAINPDLITWIEVTPDTTVSLLNGDKIIVRESLDEVIARIISFRQQAGAFRPIGALESLSLERTNAAAEQQPETASTRPSSTRPSDPRK